MDGKYIMRNDKLIDDPKLNPTFDEILFMSQDEFRDWIRFFRKEVVRLWDDEGLPPRVGFTKEGIIENFKGMIKDYSLGYMETIDHRTGKKDVIRNTMIVGNAVNEWFPTMMKTRITYGKNVAESRSIYDYFAKEELYETFVTYANRHFKRDSFYHYSNPVSVGDIVPGINEPIRGAEHFLASFKETDELAYFLCPVKRDKKYTGFNSDLKDKKNLVIDGGLSLPHDFSIRLYKKGQRLFPVGLKAFRVSFCQYAVNFPPLTARYLYERFLPRPDNSHSGDSPPAIIFDPSSGWGGRLLGAMSVSTDRAVHYIGTDPNSDHVGPGGWTKYQDFATFFNQNVRDAGLFGNHGHSFHIFQEGSEVIRNHPDFQMYKGKVDVVFTSPPYFAKEVYSEDAEQSCHKFGDYATWRDGFLKPTLETAVEWLKPGGHILWNVSDIVMSGVEHPLVQDSIDILTGLGLTHKDTLKMSLAQMPGGNRLEETGDFEEVEEHTLYETTTKKVPVMKGKMKYFCEVAKESGKGKMMLKYEPIFCFRKPLDKKESSWVAHHRRESASCE
jgi:hypothetical protein